MPRRRRRRIQNALRRFARVLRSAFTRSSSTAATATKTTARTTTYATPTKQSPIQHRHIPTEIILAFGELLKTPSLLACLQVCRHWNQALYPFVWVKITKRQWCQPSFPISPYTKLFPPFNNDNEKLNTAMIISYLRQTRSFEWSDAPANHLFDWRDHGSLLAQVSLPSLEVFQRMSNLTQLSLIGANQWQIEGGLPSILNPLNLPNLRTLVLDLPEMWPQQNIVDLYPLISRLEELDIRGFWYHGRLGEFPYTVVLVDEAMNNSSFCTARPPKQPWKLKRLKSDQIMVSFLEKCRALESLSIKNPMLVGGGYEYRQNLCTTLVRMPALKTITVDCIN
ncbi:MAG: hypothetical protein J3R72DRAFT_497183 [Linnemannia gamsii]|nr:MAG: hypothetical protein J3R72DRAFT_497183 [Linnemannia gamsii]